jgi:hypothetical protein
MNAGNADALRYKADDIVGKVMCAAKKAEAEAAKKPTVVIPDTLKRLS